MMLWSAAARGRFVKIPYEQTWKRKSGVEPSHSKFVQSRKTAISVILDRMPGFNFILFSIEFIDRNQTIHETTRNLTKKR
jgi:hypothetical protein